MYWCFAFRFLCCKVKTNMRLQMDFFFKWIQDRHPLDIKTFNLLFTLNAPFHCFEQVVICNNPHKCQLNGTEVIIVVSEVKQNVIISLRAGSLVWGIARVRRQGKQAKPARRMGRGKVNLHAGYWFLNSPRSPTTQRFDWLKMTELIIVTKTIMTFTIVPVFPSKSSTFECPRSKSSFVDWFSLPFDGSFCLCCLRASEKRDLREDGTFLSLFVLVTFLLWGLRSGVETEVGSWRFLRVTLLRSSTSALSWLVAFLISTNSLHKFQILRAHGWQTRSDRLGDYINVTPMFSHVETKTSPRLPSRFEALYKFCVDMPPDFPVPYLTVKEHLLIRQQSFARFMPFFTAFFGVSAPYMIKYCYLP